MIVAGSSAAGICLGAAALVKQVALAHALVFAPALILRTWAIDVSGNGRRRRGLLDVLAFVGGIAAIVGVAATIVVAQGAGRAAYEDIVLQARALATDTLPEPNAPSAAVRWLTGNADPKGQIPWPFGSTDYLVWWGTGSWPLWLVSVPALAHLAFGLGSDGRRRLVAGWTLAAWLQVSLPGLYWQHYYLLPDSRRGDHRRGRGMGDAIAAVERSIRLGNVHPAGKDRNASEPVAAAERPFPAACPTIVLIVAVGWTTVLQARYYLWVPPQDLTSRYKGGRQWVALRDLGRDVARRAARWDDPHLYVWGWQSPLYFYARLDSPTRHFFVDNLLRDQAGRDHPLIGPRIAEIIATLRARPPELIFAAYPPFPSLRALLSERYLPSPRVTRPLGSPRGIRALRRRPGRRRRRADQSGLPPGRG